MTKGIILSSIVLMISSFAWATVSRDSDGWTVVEPSVDSRIIFVSDSQGNDSNGGLSQANPKKTIAAGMALMRDGFPDHLLLKKGDVFFERFGNLVKSGRSSQEPMLFGSYGTGARPRLNTGQSAGMTAGTTSRPRVEFIVVMGLHFNAHTYTGAGNPTGVRWVAEGELPLFEDNLIDGYNTNLSFQEAYGDATNLRLRRNIIINAYSTDVHGQGLFFNEIDDVLIEENFFDHNGWKEGVAGAEATVFNHNVYANVNSFNVVARGNIFSRAAATGMQARTGGIIEDNLFVRNPIGLNFGYVKGGSEFKPIRDLGVTGTIKNNVVLEANDIDTKTRGQGFFVANINSGGVEISGNIIAHDQSGAYNSFGMTFSQSNGPQGLQNILIQNNIVYDWRNKGLSLETGNTQPIQDIRIENNQFQQIRIEQQSGGSYANVAFLAHPEVSISNNIYFSDPSVPSDRWFRSISINRTYEWWRDNMESTAIRNEQNYNDPNRSVASYHASLGGTESFDAFIQKLKTQSKDNWDPRYTAVEINNYIKAGFQTGGPFPGSVTRDSNGWTVVTPSADTKIVYVSKSDPEECVAFGSNHPAVGSVPEYPVGPITSCRTLAEAKTLMESLDNNHPNWLLLKRGDTWTDERIGTWRMSGRSWDEPLVIASYGGTSAHPITTRPLIQSGVRTGISSEGGDNPDHVTFVFISGLHFHAHTYNGLNGNPVGMQWRADGAGPWVEDCMFEGYSSNVQATSGSGLHTDMRLRRNIIIDAYSKSDHSQGFYTSGVHGILLEENVFDHNGWLVETGGTSAGGRTIYNHNVYFNLSSTGLVGRGNIFSRGSATGIQARSGGVLEDNLLVRNGIAVTFGHINGGSEDKPERDIGVSGSFKNNVILEGTDIGEKPSGGGILAANINSDGLDVSGNIFAHDISSPYNSGAMSFVRENARSPQGLKNITVENNVVYDLRDRALYFDLDTSNFPVSNIQIRNNQFQDVAMDNGGSGAMGRLDLPTPLVLPPPEFNYENNIYFPDPVVPANKWFRLKENGVVTYHDIDWWRANIEPTALDQELSFIDPNRSLASYNSSLGGVATFDAFITEARNQSRFNWRPAYTTYAVNQYIRDGFQVNGGPPPPPPPPDPDPPPPPSNVTLPELPRETVNADLDPAYDRSADIIVNEGDDLQEALDIVQPGQIIEIEAGKTFTGNFVLRKHPEINDSYIYIRSSAYKQLPEPGNRVSPSHSNLMPRLLSTNRNPVIRSDYGAHHYRLIGLEITTTHSTTESNFTDLVMLGRQNDVKATEFEQLPHHLIFDRIYFHGTPTGNVENAIRIDARYLAVMDSYFTDFQFVGRDGGYGLKAYNGPGPFKIVNNFFEVAGINILFGGGAPTVPNVVASDVLISGNYFTKKLSWKTTNEWNVKNLFELKNAKRVHIVGNVFENCWVRGQTGEAIVLSVRNSGGIPSRVHDITIENNIIRDVGRAISISGEDSNAGATPSFQTERIFITNNLFKDIRSDFNPNPRFIQTNTGHDLRRPVLDLTITHNTTLFKEGDVGNSIMFNEKTPGVENLLMENNIMMNGTYGVFQWDTTNINPMLKKNVLVYVEPQNPPDTNDFESTYTSENFKADRPSDVGFENYAAGNYRLASTSLYKDAGTDGRDIGVDMNALLAATACVEAGTCEAPPDDPDSDPEDPAPTPIPDPEPAKEEDPEKFVNVASRDNGFSFEIPCESEVRIYSQNGDLVTTLSCSGDVAIWDASGVPAGIYFVYRFGHEPRKVVVVK